MAVTEIPAAERAPGRLTGAANATLQFLGGAGTVTGAMYRIHTSAGDILLDCGLFQGLKQLRLRNWSVRVPDAASIAAVVLSHAHIDHVGYLPRLVREGFRGPIYCTAGTADLVSVLLPDCAHLQEEEAERANRRGYSKHRPALPLYTSQDAEAVSPLLQSVPYDTAYSILPGVTGVLRPAGHILGSAIVELALDHRRLVYSGDLGRGGRAMGTQPAAIARADVLLLESTYGDRQHPSGGKQDLARVVNDAARRGGALLIPAFAVDRTQEVVALLDQLEAERAIPELPVYLDSPLAIEATEIYARRGKFRVPERYRFARTPEESRALNELHGPVIIISASGMATGGRVLHHLAMRLPDERTTVLLVGFQSAGTRGRLLADGAREIKMLGQLIPVRAHIEQIDALSAHADRDEILRWLGGFARSPGMTYLVHGEPAAAQALASEITRQLGWRVRVAIDGETVPLA
ncbi:MAG TPA: MBL fold metallo-hydrolase [Gemmatimonadales bacterium]